MPILKFIPEVVTARSFFKDGYTDLRGRFDYGQLSGKDISTVEKFSIFIQHEEYGSIVKEAKVPNGVAPK